jgi:F0F1-type ATP synthase membrane subunit b/b'
MLIFLGFVVNTWVAAYWLKTTIDDRQAGIAARLDEIEQRLLKIEEQGSEPKGRE